MIKFILKFLCKNQCLKKQGNQKFTCLNFVNAKIKGKKGNKFFVLTALDL